MSRLSKPRVLLRRAIRPRSSPGVEPHGFGGSFWIGASGAADAAAGGVSADGAGGGAGASGAGLGAGASREGSADSTSGAGNGDSSLADGHALGECSVFG